MWLSLASAAGVALFVLFHFMGLVHYSDDHLLIKGVLIGLFLLTAHGAARHPDRAQPLFAGALFITTALIGLIVVLEPHEYMALVFMGFTIFGTFMMGGLRAGLVQFALTLSILLALLWRHPQAFGSGFYVYMGLFFALCALLGGAVFVQIHHLFLRIRNYERTLSDLAHTDELTGLLNLRGFMRQGQACFEAHLRDGVPLSLALIDLDYFKQLNDTHGHGAGNVGLQHIAALLRASLPEDALLGRFGGDEMIALLPCCTEVQARRHIDRLYERLKATPAVFEHQTLRLSLSIGVSALDPQRDQSLHDLLERADEALYEAKARGRGQACYAEELTPVPTTASA